MKNQPSFGKVNWELQSIQSQLEMAEQNRKSLDSDDNEKKRHRFWNNISQSISPFSVYKYLKARFGPPNGFVMALKNQTSDNLIHWHYALATSQAIINIWGKTSGLEITIKTVVEMCTSE